MTRLIKFRVWDGKKMYLPKNETIFKNASFWQVGVSDGETINKEKVEQFSIMQFTGLKDKNGKEIYEGDIVDVWSAGTHLPNGIIKFGQGAAKFFIGNESNSICWNLSGGGHDYKQENLEIIGNIFENPELLEVKN